MTVIATATDPDGRGVVLTQDGWEHIVDGHQDMVGRQNLVMKAISSPDQRAIDPIRGRERYWLRDQGPSRWLRVVVDFSDEPAEVVTAFPERKAPPGSNR